MSGQFCTLAMFKKENTIELLLYSTRKTLSSPTCVKVTKKQFTSCSKFKSPDVDSSGSFTWTAPAKPEVKNQLQSQPTIMYP